MSLTTRMNSSAWLITPTMRTRSTNGIVAAALRSPGSEHFHRNWGRSTGQAPRASLCSKQGLDFGRIDRVRDELPDYRVDPFKCTDRNLALCRSQSRTDPAFN